MNTNVNTRRHAAKANRRAGKLARSATGIIPATQNYPSITKQSQFPAPTTKNFVTKPGKSHRPAANPHRISKRLSKNPEILGFDIQNVGFGDPLSRVRWAQNPPSEPNRTRATSPPNIPHLPPAYNGAIPAFQRTFCDR